MKNLTKSATEMLALVGCETEAQMFEKAGPDAPKHVQVLWSQIGQAFWDFQRAEGQVADYAAKAIADAQRVLETLEQGFAPSTTWLAQSAQEADKARVAMEAAADLMKQLARLLNAINAEA